MGSIREMRVTMRAENTKIRVTVTSDMVGKGNVIMSEQMKDKVTIHAGDNGKTFVRETKLHAAGWGRAGDSDRFRVRVGDINETSIRDSDRNNRRER